MRAIFAALVATTLLLAPASPARAADDPDFPFSTGAAPADMVPLDLPYTPRIAMWFPTSATEAQRQRAVAVMSEHLSLLPPAHRAALRQVVFDPGAYPGAGKVARRLGRPTFTAAAIALPNAMVIYRNPPSPDWLMVRSVILHEMGHCFADARFGSSAPPAAWVQAAKADGTHLSAYSRNNIEATGSYVEDFAEAYEAFFQARTQGGDVPDKYKARFPYRWQLLETYTY